MEVLHLKIPFNYLPSNVNKEKKHAPFVIIEPVINYLNLNYNLISSKRLIMTEFFFSLRIRISVLKKIIGRLKFSPNKTI